MEKKEETPESPLPLCVCVCVCVCVPCENTVRRQLSARQKRAVTRNQICQHFDLELAVSLGYAAQTMVLCYSNLK